MAQNLGDEKVLAIPALFACYETKPNALACARNEKVACSSQVTSSRKTPGFLVKPGVFITFWGGLKASQIGLALIWRYFFEAVIFWEKREIEKPDFPNFSEVICFWRKIDAIGQGKLIIPQTRRIPNFLSFFWLNDYMTILDETTTFQKIPKVDGYTIIWRYFLRWEAAFGASTIKQSR